MRIDTGWEAYDSGRRRAYRAGPPAPAELLPIVLVLQEAWGVDGHIRDVSERFATAGYLAVAPDLYWVDGARPEDLSEDRVEQVKAFLDTLPPTAWADQDKRDAAIASLPPNDATLVRESLGAVFGNVAKSDEHLATVGSLIAHLRADASLSSQPMVAIGFCMGGGLSFRLACQKVGLVGAVVCYGSAPADDKLGDLSCPVLGLYGADDHRITDGVPHVAEMAAVTAISFEYEIYQDTPHAFFNDTRSSYRVTAARDAWARVLSFFGKTTDTAR
jgi:carboxymethylenebutenolidase